MFGRLLCLVSIFQIGVLAWGSPRLPFENGVRLRKVLQSTEKSGFLTAAMSGDLSEMERLHNNGYDVNERALGGFTAIHVASVRGDAEMAGRLIEWGADVNAKGNNGTTALHMAGMRGDVKMAGLLLGAQADANVADNRKFTPLHFAAFGKIPEGYGIEELYKSPAKAIRDTYAEEDHGTAKPYFFPSFVPNHLEVASMLLRKGADPNAATVVGETPLHYVSSYDRDKITQLLIDWDANMEIEDVQRERPLHEAVAYGAIRAVGVLLKSGADTYAREENGLNPREFVCRCRLYKSDPTLNNCAPGKCVSMTDTLVIEAMIDTVRSRQG